VPTQNAAWWRNWALWGIVALIVLTALYALTVTSFARSASTEVASFPPAGAATGDYVQLDATMLTVDPVLNSYTMRLNFTPHGAYAGTVRNTLAKPVELTINDVNGAKTQDFAAGEAIPITDVTLDALGQTDNYPIDQHTFTLDLTARDSAGKPMALRTDWRAAVDDWVLDPSTAQPAVPGEVTLSVTARRSPSVLIMAFGLMVVLVLLVIVNVIMVMRAIRLHKVEFTTLASLGATLFAIPGIRNGMPGAPPVGTLADFLVFFWALMIVGLCLVAAAVSWFHTASVELKAAPRPPKDET
jgi:hypothetical protein